MIGVNAKTKSQKEAWELTKFLTDKEMGVRLGEGQDEILALADGRRSPRDLAFALGHGVYATMLRLAWMQQAGLLVPVPARAFAAAARTPGRAGSGGEPPDVGGLPQRQRNLPAPSRRLRAPARLPERLMPLGLLRPRTGRDVSQGETS